MESDITMKKFRTLCIDEVAKQIEPPVLYIIGNGFDLMHGVRSRYTDFRDALGRDSDLLYTLETFIHVPDIWGDFENNLAYLDRGMMMGRLDECLDDFDVKEEDDDDFSAADFFLAQEAAASPVYVLTEDLPRAFRKWINKLKVPGNADRKLAGIIRKGSRYINFNYTEFLETLYGIPSSDIVYIHGDRRNRKQELVLGHGRDSFEIFEEWYERNKNKYRDFVYDRKGRKHRNSNPVYLAYFLDDDMKGNWRSQKRYDAINNTADIIGRYYFDSAKKTAAVLEENKELFSTLDYVRSIVVIGHSLSAVDQPYFDAITKGTDKPQCFFSWYSEPDLQRIDDFAAKYCLNSEDVNLFHTG